MDASQWQALVQADTASRWMNRRYLVVPIRRNLGVFHPKLSLLLTDQGGQMLCGSNNLTRSGCSSNLELLNSIPFNFASEEAQGPFLAQETLKFFARASEDTDEEVGRIVRKWLADARQRYPWPQPAGISERSVRLVHTYDGPILDQISELVSVSEPREIFVVSPFHDADGQICREIADRWPKAQVELLVQQRYTALPVDALRIMPAVRLAEILDTPRRVHAKLFAWRGKAGSGCLVGSANFTSAAFQGRNVEAGLLISDARSLIDKLFDSDLSKQQVPLDDFEPGDEQAPEAEEWTQPPISISSAVLDEFGRLTVVFQNRLSEPIKRLRLTLRPTAGASRTHELASESPQQVKARSRWCPRTKSYRTLTEHSLLPWSLRLRRNGSRAPLFGLSRKADSLMRREKAHPPRRDGSKKPERASQSTSTKSASSRV